MSHLSIGTSQFTFLRRNDQRGAMPEILEETKSIMRRPGVDGTSVRLEGKAGRPFQMTSLRDVEDADDAWTEVDAYKAMEESQDPQDVIWNSVNFTTQFSTKYVVLRVSDFSLRRVSNVAGPVRQTATPAYILNATWDLLPVEA